MRKMTWALAIYLQTEFEFMMQATVAMIFLVQLMRYLVART